MKPKVPLKIDDNVAAKKVYFGDNGEVVDKPVVKKKAEKLKQVEVTETETSEVAENPKKGFAKRPQHNGQDLGTRWYQVHEEFNTSEFKDMKDSELATLQQLCRSCFNEEIQKLTKSGLLQSQLE